MARFSRNPNMDVSRLFATKKAGGIVQFATDAQAEAGTRTDRAIGCDTLAAELSRRAELPGAVQYATVTVSSAELLALRATPKTLVAAQGAGKAIQLLSAQLFLDYNSAGYTESSDNMAIRYTDGSGVIVSQAIEATGFIDQTADTLTVALPKIDAIAAATGALNKALVLHNTGDGEYESGDSPLIVKIAYIVHNFA